MYFYINLIYIPRCSRAASYGSCIYSTMVLSMNDVVYELQKEWPCSRCLKKADPCSTFVTAFFSSYIFKINFTTLNIGHTNGKSTYTYKQGRTVGACGGGGGVTPPQQLRIGWKSRSQIVHPTFFSVPIVR